MSGTDDGAFRNTFFASETHIRDVALMRYLGGDKEVLIVGSRGHSNALHQLAGLFSSTAENILSSLFTDKFQNMFFTVIHM